MRAYKVIASLTDAGVQITRSRYAGTQADARAEKQSLMNDYTLKRNQVEVLEIEIPTGKADLIAFINDLID